MLTRFNQLRACQERTLAGPFLSSLPISMPKRSEYQVNAYSSRDYFDVPGAEDNW